MYSSGTQQVTQWYEKNYCFFFVDTFSPILNFFVKDVWYSPTKKSAPIPFPPLNKTLWRSCLFSSVRIIRKIIVILYFKMTKTTLAIMELLRCPSLYLRFLGKQTKTKSTHIWWKILHILSVWVRDWKQKGSTQQQAVLVKLHLTLQLVKREKLLCYAGTVNCKKTCYLKICISRHPQKTIFHVPRALTFHVLC